mgnify:CR=1 FL=1
MNDGTELGITEPDAGTDTSSGCYVADADPDTMTDPDDPDSDRDSNDGLTDGEEDWNGDGAFDPVWETDPNVGSDDADEDNDGIADTIEGDEVDSDGDGAFDWVDTDSDGDGIPDGEEWPADSDDDSIPDFRDTDSDGDDASNMNLSKARSASATKWLVDHNIACKRLMPVGFGETKPLVANDSAENKAKNRRVSFFDATIKGKPVLDENTKQPVPVDGGGQIAVDPCNPAITK